MKKLFIALFLVIGLFISKANAYEQRIPFNVTQTTFTTTCSINPTTCSSGYTTTTVTYAVRIAVSEVASINVCPATIGGTLILGAACMYCNSVTSCVVDQPGSWVAIINSDKQFAVSLTQEVR